MNRAILRGRRHGGPRAAAVAEPPELAVRAPAPTGDLPPTEPADGHVVYRGQRRPMSAAEWQAAGYPLEEARHRLDAIRVADTCVEVLVITRDGVGPLTHYPFHSDRFEWGYRGPGPADLARCILLHHYRITPVLRGRRYPPKTGELPVSYQAFKCEVIARLAQDRPWELTATRIREWARSRR